MIVQAALGRGGFILAYHLASRLAYVVGVGVALKQEDEHRSITRRLGLERGFQVFKRFAAALMNNDAISFFILCIVTEDTLHRDLPPIVPLVGIAFGLLGIGIKMWAARSLEQGAFFWRNFFFTPLPGAQYQPRGPYRFLNNPMYTIGYIHMYGWALVMGSLPGLIIAAFDQVAMLLFYQLVEKPHYARSATTLAQRDLTDRDDATSLRQQDGPVPLV